MNQTEPMSTTLTVSTPDGPGELVVDPAVDACAVLLLGHGAGSDVSGWDLALLARELPAREGGGLASGRRGSVHPGERAGRGVTVIRYRQPHRVAGRKLPGSTASLDRGWAPALAAVREAWPELSLFVGGHSAGARTACRGFNAATAGVVLLSFPLHPPGQPAKSRIAELAGVGGPVLVFQGTRDTFGTPIELRSALGAGRDNIQVVEVPDATHPLAPLRSASTALVETRERSIVDTVRSFIEAQLAESRPDEPGFWSL